MSKEIEKELSRPGITSEESKDHIVIAGRLTKINQYKKIRTNEIEASDRHVTDKSNERILNITKEFFANRDKFISHYNHGRTLTDEEIITEREKSKKQEIPYKFETMPDGSFKVTPFESNDVK